MSGGFTVNEDELRTYAGKLADQKGTAGDIAGLVDTADVGDESWGVVGIFVKGKYTEMLGDLKDLCTDLQNGLQSGSDKFTQAADGYRQHEDAVVQLLDGLKVQIDN
ncbi:ESX-1 secretion-associated protein [Amycolatopsis cihanbeyliensis]|uniref:Excreted virulence factor EspC (Type VII ESX diderm) n=1 Tax=Amycolatopsis cihanbeyliensis TaxID=1128664 RepID=A0A542DJV4_AMYCI|nr:ESX-1 secretion-associated protein [Amycolatopsis cihanbeyliensis]TQJ03215.1 excreted virulence factor EspC (type VII ESX diderm) [Amycolatopsis cihanbeyliensis]